jgi:hypothetical protein
MRIRHPRHCHPGEGVAPGLGFQPGPSPVQEVCRNSSGPTGGASGESRGKDALGTWAESLSSQAGKLARGRLRFAFYGRVSTEDWQGPVTSRVRQLQQAMMLGPRSATWNSAKACRHARTADRE